MKKTALKMIYPMSKGLDLTSIPGTQDPRSLKKASNIVLRTKPSIKKRPGLRRIPYVGKDDGVQGAIHYFGTYGGSQVDEIVRVRKGNLEVIRDGNLVDLGVTVSDTDTVTFSRFANVLIIHFENSRPVYYSVGGTTTTNLAIPSSHVNSPPSFSRVHDFRLWYSGRPSDPHRIWVSAVNDPQEYALINGGFSIRVRDGDGDPKGITGISQPFRGDLYASKWNSWYRIYRSQYGYGVDVLTDEVGTVHHNTIVSTQNDIYFVSTQGIHSLTMTDKYGAAESATISYPIYEWFQENVNWSDAKNMKMTYDKPSNALLLSYTSSSGATNDKILGFNTVSKEFFLWEDCEYPALGNYFDFGRQTTFIHCAESGTSILDDKENTINGKPIDLEIETGTIFPMENPKIVVTFTQAWLLVRPTSTDVNVEVAYSIDGKEEHSTEVNTKGAGYGSLIDTVVSDLSGVIGTDIIGKNSEDMVVLPFPCVGDGSAISFHVKQFPPNDDPDEPCEIYGIIFEYNYNEDTEDKVKI